jgi:hypothetical protein
VVENDGEDCKRVVVKCGANNNGERSLALLYREGQLLPFTGILITQQWIITTPHFIKTIK